MRKSKSEMPAGQRLFGFYYHLAGKKAYYFLLTNPLKQSLLEMNLKRDTAFYLEDYGTIVASGYGEPSEAVKMLLRESYDAVL